MTLRSKVEIPASTQLGRTGHSREDKLEADGEEISATLTKLAYGKVTAGIKVARLANELRVLRDFSLHIYRSVVHNTRWRLNHPTVG